MRLPPELGLRVGHWTDHAAATGCTVVLCPPGTHGGVSVRGGAPCTRETDILRLGAGVEPREVHAIVLAGGSVFGLAAVDGVVAELAASGIGLRTGDAVVPIVPAAGIYDLGVGDAGARPGPEAGRAACRAASSEVEEGSVGAGTGATVAKMAGMGHCVKGGFGARAERAGSRTLLALAVVNALGEIVDPETGRVVAAPRAAEGEALRDPGDAPGNTTLIVVATDAPLDREQLIEMAGAAHDGLAAAVRPAHTRLDGDVVFALSVPSQGSPPSFAERIALGLAARRSVERAILRGVTAATGLHGIPAAGDLPGP